MIPNLSLLYRRCKYSLDPVSRAEGWARDTQRCLFVSVTQSGRVAGQSICTYTNEASEICD